jgi:hypothetical protein
MRASGYSEDDVELAIDAFGLENAVNTALLKIDNKNHDLVVETKFRIVGEKIKELFFQTYPGLQKRVERERKFALKHGYTRTWVGLIRHLPEIRYLSINTNGAVIGADKKLFGNGKLALHHLLNDSVNTAIQTAEVYHAMPDVTTIGKNLQEWDFKSYVYNFVHDSFELYVYKPERRIVYALIQKVASIKRQPYYGIPIEMDGEESDLNDPEQYLKHGKEIKEKFDLDKELDDWNFKHGTKLEFKSWIPVHGEVK